MLISDFHNDYLTDPEYKELFKKYLNDGVKVVGALFRGKRSFDEIYSRAKSFKALSGGRLPFAFEDFGYESEFEREKLIALAPLCVGLTWNGENALASGCKAEGGLKKAGYSTVIALNEAKITVDAAHLNERSFYDLADAAERISCTHTCFYDVCPHPRNLKSEQLKIIVERGGLVGLALYKPFLTDKENCTACDVVRQVDYFAERFGLENLCIGSDFYGADEYPVGIADYDGFSLIKEEMLGRGYGSDEIYRVFFKNLFDFISQNSR